MFKYLLVRDTLAYMVVSYFGGSTIVDLCSIGWVNRVYSISQSFKLKKGDMKSRIETSEYSFHLVIEKFYIFTRLRTVLFT
jgi:hypothetical protein